MEPAAPSNIPLVPRAPGDPIPVTAVQRRLCERIIQKRDRLSDLRMVAGSVRIWGELDIPLLRSSLEAVVRRHESLRTKIRITDHGLQQHIDAAGGCPLDIVDLSDSASKTAEEQARRRAQEFVDRKVDICAGPLFEPLLMKLDERQHVLILVADHLISDGISYTILNREVWRMYQQRIHPTLPVIPIQFADYAVWQERTRPAWMQQHRDYWIRRLVCAPQALPPFDGVPTGLPNDAVSVLNVPFGKSLTIEMTEAAQREGARLVLLALSAYVAAMAHWCNQSDLVFTFVSHGRHRPELEHLIGYLAHHLYFRIDLQKKDSFRDLLERVRVEFHSAYEHQDYSRVPDLIPECSTELNFNWAPMNWTRGFAPARQSLNGLEIQPFPLRNVVIHNLSTIFSDTPSGICATIAYRSNLFAQSTIERLGNSLRWFAQQIVQQPHTSISAGAPP